jgi:diguanylate cyclase (GGDEF)-like protein
MRFVPAWTHKSILIDFEIREVEIEGDTWKILFLQDAEQNRRRELILEKEASTDELSGLANRRAFQRCLESHQNHALVLAILDIDHFKNINDLYGHPTGDEVIRHTGKLLNEAFSKSSLVVARLGGDEFGILFDAATVKAASSALEEFCHRIKLTGSPECSEFSYSVSIGISIAEKAGVAPRELLTVADKALYQAKNAGRNCVRSKKIQKS